MANGDNLIGTVKNLSEKGKLSTEATNSLVLASLSDVLTVVREIKNDNVDIKESITVLVENRGKNKDEIDILRKRSWAADAIAGALAAVGIIIGASKG